MIKNKIDFHLHKRFCYFSTDQDFAEAAVQKLLALVWRERNAHARRQSNVQGTGVHGLQENVVLLVEVVLSAESGQYITSKYSHSPKH